MKNLLNYLGVLLFLIPFVTAAQEKKLDALFNSLKTETTDTGRLSKTNQISEILWRMGSYDSAMNHALQAKDLAEEVIESKDTSIARSGKISLATTYRIIGIIFRHRGNYSLALEYDFKAFSMNQALGNKKGMTANLNNIGIVYWDMGNYSKALENYLKAIDLSKETGNKRGVADNIGNIGLLYKMQKNYAKAIEYDSMALVLQQQLGDQEGVSTNLGNLASVFEALNNYKKSLEFNYKALAIVKKLYNKYGIITNFMDIASAYKCMYKYPISMAYYDSALAIAKQIGERFEIERAYQGIYPLDSAMGNYNAEAEDFKKFISYRDSLENEEITKKEVQAEMNHQFEQQQIKQKAEQDKKDAIARADEKREKVTILFISIGLIIVIAFSGLLYSRFKLTQKQNGIIEGQKILVEEKNKALTDSINYAKRLQDAILPPLPVIAKNLPDSFLLYKPKDIVAGDFYWMERAGDSILVAAADSTGHGVPGAMVSVVCSNALNRTVKEFKITEPGKILDKVRELVLETFEKSENDVQDGMDISLCSINTQTCEVKWSGANNPLLYFQDGTLKELDADKQPVGKHDKAKPFSTHEVKLNKGDTLYLFTDGYADQFGGPKGKKFKYKQFQQLIMDNAKLTMEKQKNMLEKTLNEWKGQLEQVDDILIMGIRV